MSTRTLAPKPAGKQITQIKQVVPSKPSVTSSSAAKAPAAAPPRAAPVVAAPRAPSPPPEPTVWRCQICTFMNGPTLDMCSKCKEPVTHEQKLAQSIDKERAVRAGGVAKLPPAPASPVAARAAAAVVAKPSAPAGLPPPPPRQPARSNGTGGGGGNENKISKANIHGTVHSKLNHATASYQAKFEKDGPPQKGANVQTLKSMTVNGFVSSATRDRAAKAAAAPQVSKPHEAPPVKIRPKYQSGGGVAVGSAGAAAAPAAAAEPKKYFNPIEEKPLKKWTGPETGGRGGLINMLQEACSGAAQASLKHTGPTHKTEFKSLDGYQTAFQL